MTAGKTSLQDVSNSKGLLQTSFFNTYDILRPPGELKHVPTAGTHKEKQSARKNCDNLKGKDNHARPT